MHAFGGRCIDVLLLRWPGLPSVLASESVTAEERAALGHLFTALRQGMARPADFTAPANEAVDKEDAEDPDEDGSGIKADAAPGPPLWSLIR
jgi:hypothetical protein